jgi:hypothetical protein
LEGLLFVLEYRMMKFDDDDDDDDGGRQRGLAA